MVITLSEFLTILAFKFQKIFHFGLKIGILKMLFENSVSSTHSATLFFNLWGACPTLINILLKIIR